MLFLLFIILTHSIVLLSNICSNQILCLWESVYPPMLAYGSPVRQHLVVYMHLCLKQAAADVQMQVRYETVNYEIYENFCIDRLILL